jgi:hypothetical protein
MRKPRERSARGPYFGGVTRESGLFNSLDTKVNAFVFNKLPVTVTVTVTVVAFTQRGSLMIGAGRSPGSATLLGICSGLWHDDTVKIIQAGPGRE